jgi:hypothetical protein
MVRMLVLPAERRFARNNQIVSDPLSELDGPMHEDVSSDHLRRNPYL